MPHLAFLWLPAGLPVGAQNVHSSGVNGGWIAPSVDFSKEAFLG